MHYSILPANRQGCEVEASLQRARVDLHRVIREGDPVDCHAAVEGAAGSLDRQPSRACPLGLAHCVVIARDFLGDDDFLMYLGDNVVPDGISTLVDRFHARPSDAMVLLGPVPNPTEYGVAEVDGGEWC